MKTGNEKYDRIVEVLRKSAPESAHYDIIEERVMEKISRKGENAGNPVLDLLFGWVYIGWVRKTLVAASFAMLGFFIWQQHSIMSRIDELRSSIRDDNRMVIYNPNSSLEKRQMLLKYSRERSEGYYVHEEDLLKILDSLDQLNIRYRDLRELIDDDPQLRKMVEEKLEKKLGSRIKL